MDPALDGLYVNIQLGEVSVTNPVDGAYPEVFSLVGAPGALSVIRHSYSSLSPGVSLMSESERETFFSTVSAIHNHFARLYGVNARECAFEIEFKYDGPRRELVIKQIRPYAGTP